MAYATMCAKLRLLFEFEPASRLRGPYRRNPGRRAVPHGPAHGHDAGLPSLWFPPGTGACHIESSYGLNAAEQARGHYAAGEGVTGHGYPYRTPPWSFPTCRTSRSFSTAPDSRNLRQDAVSFICVPIRADDQAHRCLVRGSAFCRHLHSGGRRPPADHHCLHAGPRGQGSPELPTGKGCEPNRRQKT